jgi:hypothetical protein
MDSVVILSYCDTEYKKVQLKNLIKSTRKKFPYSYILVYSHYQNVEPQYYEGSDFYIFDKSNPKSEKLFNEWMYINSQQKTFFRIGEDWGYAVLQMIKRSSMFLKSLGKNECLFLNYDCNCDDVENLDIDSKILKLRRSDVGIFTNWIELNRLALTQFYLRLNLVDYKFLDLINYDYYSQLPGNMIPEDIWYHIIENSFGVNYKVDEIKIGLSISVNPRNLPSESSLNQYFDTFLATRDKNTNRKCLAIWNSKLVINQLRLIVNGVEKIYQTEIIEEYRYHSFFCHLDDNEIDSITITGINDFDIDTYRLENLTDSYWFNNYHE